MNLQQYVSITHLQCSTHTWGLWIELWPLPSVSKQKWWMHWPKGTWEYNPFSILVALQTNVFPYIPNVQKNCRWSSESPETCHDFVIFTSNVTDVCSTQTWCTSMGDCIYKEKWRNNLLNGLLVYREAKKGLDSPAIPAWQRLKVMWC